MDYNELGLMMGLEIHQQLDTKTKLFCPCECELTDKNLTTMFYGISGRLKVN